MTAKNTNIKRKYAVIVPSKNRPKVLQNFIDKHYLNLKNQNVDLIVVLEKNDVSLTKIIDQKIVVVKLQKLNQGVGYARNKAVEYCYNNKYTHCLFSDDNAYWDDTNVKRFLDDVKGEIKWLAAWRRLYEFWRISYMIVFGIDVNAIIKTGNFDKKLLYIEDSDMVIRIKKRYGNNSIKSSKLIIFAKKRHQKGGLSEFKTEKAYRIIENYLNKKYDGEYFKYYKKTNTIRTNWTKLENIYLNDRVQKLF